MPYLTQLPACAALPTASAVNILRLLRWYRGMEHPFQSPSQVTSTILVCDDTCQVLSADWQAAAGAEVVSLVYPWQVPHQAYLWRLRPIKFKEVFTGLTFVTGQDLSWAKLEIRIKTACHFTSSLSQGNAPSSLKCAPCGPSDAARSWPVPGPCTAIGSSPLTPRPSNLLTS